MTPPTITKRCDTAIRWLLFCILAFFYIRIYGGLFRGDEQE